MNIKEIIGDKMSSKIIGGVFTVAGLVGIIEGIVAINSMNHEMDMQVNRKYPLISPQTVMLADKETLALNRKLSESITLTAEEKTKLDQDKQLLEQQRLRSKYYKQVFDQSPKETRGSLELGIGILALIAGLASFGRGIKLED
jgi:hypothetical protein